MAHEEQGLGLGTDQLFALLQQKLLPVLPVQDMIRLMATSQILRNMVMNADIGEQCAAISNGVACCHPLPFACHHHTTTACMSAAGCMQHA